MRTILSGRFVAGDFLRKAWRANLTRHAPGRRLTVLALLVGLVLPAAILTVSAAVSLKTTVLCEPHPIAKGGNSYTRPAFHEFHWYNWWGWDHYGDQQGQWARRGIHPFEKIDRTLVDRSIVLTRPWTISGSRAFKEDIGLISSTVVGSWVLVAVWLAFVGNRARKLSASLEVPSILKPNVKGLGCLVLAASGVLLALLVALELIIRLTVPEFGIGGRGNEWHAFRSYLPWSIAIPAVFLWRLCSKGPPGVARWACWPALAVGAAVAFLVRLIVRLRVPTHSRYTPLRPVSQPPSFQ